MAKKQKESAPGVEGQIALQFGHNTTVNQIVIYFGIPVPFLTFTPEQGELFIQSFRERLDLLAKDMAALNNGNNDGSKKALKKRHS